MKRKSNKWKRWGKKALLFSTPAILAFLIALQGGASIEFALGAGYSALLSAVIGALREQTKEKK